MICNLFSMKHFNGYMWKYKMVKYLENWKKMQ